MPAADRISACGEASGAAVDSSSGWSAWRGNLQVLCRRSIAGVRLRHDSRRRAPKRRTQGCNGATGSRRRDRSPAWKLSEAWIEGAHRLRVAATLSVQLRFGAPISGAGRGLAGCRCAGPAPASRHKAANVRVGGCDPDRPRHGGRQADLQFASCNRNRTATGLEVFSPLRSLQGPAQLVEAEARAKRVRWMVRSRGGACSLDATGIDMARSPSRFLSLAGARVGSFARRYLIVCKEGASPLGATCSANGSSPTRRPAAAPRRDPRHPGAVQTVCGIKCAPAQ